MSLRTIGLLTLALGATTAATTARADAPACPATLGSYTADVQGNDVIVCPTTAPVPGVGSNPGCPFTLGMLRVDVATGATQEFTGPCVADPQNGDADAGTPCYLDSCVAPGTYEYGYGLAPFAGCANAACAGPTSGEWAVVANVTATPSGCTPSAANGPTAIWTTVDAGIEDGAVPWSGTCHGPLPDPDGGYCAWDWAADGSAEWAPCPPDGGTLCPWWGSDGGVSPGPCPNPIDAGHAGTGSPSSPDAGGSSPDAGEQLADNNVSTGGGGGGCSTAPGGGAAPLAPLLGLAFAFALRAARRKKGSASANG